jgi:hypothetical protein
MNKKILIISASVLILAVIVGMGFYAQGSKSATGANTEQTNMPEKCKKCPSQSKCAEGKDATATSACEKKCAEKKEMKCEGMKESGTSACTKEKASCSDTTKCAGMKAEAKGCPKSTTCEKKCEKK